MSCDHPKERKTQMYTDLGLKCSENIIKSWILAYYIIDTICTVQ